MSPGLAVGSHRGFNCALLRLLREGRKDLTAQINAAVASYSSNQAIWKHTFRGTRLMNLLEQPSRENSLQTDA